MELTVAHLSIANVRMFAELFWPLFRRNNVSLILYVFTRALFFCHVAPLPLDLVLILFAFDNGSSRVSYSFFCLILPLIVYRHLFCVTHPFRFLPNQKLT